MLGKTVGNIRIVDHLGRGGMGEVFVGYDEKLKRKVALKAISSEKRMKQSARTRFSREAQVLSQLNHPHICQIYDFIEDQGHDYLVLELIDGTNLRHAKESKTFSGKLDIAEQLSKVLVATHEKDIIHRDLKPENIMVTEKGLIKVLDFGLSSTVDPSDAATIDEEDATDSGDRDVWKTRVGTVMGTPRYMSPEQAKGESATAASDMFSFGLILQELFTGRGPYEEDLTQETQLWKTMMAETLPVEGLDPDLTELIERLKSPSPQLRPNAVETLDRLKWIRSKPARRVKRWAITTLVLLLLAGTTLSTIGFLMAKKQRDRANHERDRAKATVDLLFEFLTSVEPDGKGRDVKVIELVEAFEPRIAEMDQQPEIQASLYRAYGIVHDGLGLYDQASDYFNLAYDLSVDALGEGHPEALGDLHNIAICYDLMGRFEEAEAILRQLLDIHVKEEGPESFPALKTAYSLAIVTDSLGNAQEAEKMFRDILEKQERLLGPDDDMTLMTLNSLAITIDRQNRSAESETLFREVWSKQKEILGPKHPATVDTQFNMAISIDVQNRHREAEAIVRDVLSSMVEIYGPDHPRTLGTKNTLGAILMNLDELEEAETLLSEARKMTLASLGPEHPLTNAATANLSILLRELGRIEEAEAIDPGGKLSDPHPQP